MEAKVTKKTRSGGLRVENFSGTWAYLLTLEPPVVLTGVVG